MFDYADATAFAVLDRELIKILDGEQQGVSGLREALVNSPNWEYFLGTRGRVQAYLHVREMMKQIAADMDKNDDRRQWVGRAN